MPARGGSVAKRLRWYWQMEAANVVLVPATAFGLVWSGGGTANAALWVAAVACSALLVVGTLYWRAVLRRIEGDARAFNFWLPRLAAAESLSLFLVAVSALIFALELILSGQGWTPETIAAAVLTVLAALEYVNYYMVQLQHFDNWADFRRLMTGRGFGKAHMARDIAAWRSKRSAKLAMD